MKDKRLRRLRNAFISLAIICMTPLCENGHPLNGARPAMIEAGQEFMCVIDLGNDMYDSHGLETGMHYELLKRFAKDNRCSVRIRLADKGEDILDSLSKGKIDMAVVHNEDTAGHDGVVLSRDVTNCTTWALKSSDTEAVRHINHWIGHIKASSEFSAISKSFKVSDPIKKAAKGLKTDLISPYDDLIRKYASLLGWDWRMLAAVVYQESRFAISSRSHRGASGLMQVMPFTGKSYGVEDLLDPEENLKAGTGHLIRLQKQLTGCGVPHEELVKFTLAAYNAGEGRIADCRNFAKAQNRNSNSWDEIVSIIPLMREDSILDEESVKLGKFQGHETIAYVSSIMEIYDAFCSIG